MSTQPGVSRSHYTQTRENFEAEPSATNTSPLFCPLPSFQVIDVTHMGNMNLCLGKTTSTVIGWYQSSCNTHEVGML